MNAILCENCPKILGAGHYLVQTKAHYSNTEPYTTHYCEDCWVDLSYRPLAPGECLVVTNLYPIATGVLDKPRKKRAKNDPALAFLLAFLRNLQGR